MAAKADGAFISSALVFWNDVDEGKKGRFVVSLNLLSERWNNCGVPTERIVIRVDTEGRSLLSSRHRERIQTSEPPPEHENLIHVLLSWHIF